MKGLFLAAVLATSAPAYGQRGAPIIVRNYNVLPFYYGSVDLGDYDGDGDLDVLATGRAGDVLATKVYCRAEIEYTWEIGEEFFADTMTTFRESATNLPSLWQSSAKWGDYDADGDLDFVVSGLNTVGTESGSETVTRIFENRNNLFFLAQSLPGVFAGEVAWGDYDGDGDLDLVATGASEMQADYGPLTRIFRNDGGRFIDIQAHVPNVAFGAAAWADVDGDGDLDLALLGDQGGGRFITDVFLNGGNGRFEAMNAGLPSLAFGSLDWGDVDSDGDPDLLITGGTYDPNLLRGVTQIYENDGGRLRLKDLILPGVVFGSADWVDYNLDGMLDVVLTGSPDIPSQGELSLYLNNSTSFDLAFTHSGLIMSDIAIGDYNSDGDPDIVAIGRTIDGLTFMNFFQNETFHDPNMDDFDPRIVEAIRLQVRERFGCRTPAAQ